MIIVMKVGSPDVEVKRVSEEMQQWGLNTRKNYWQT